jgi:UDP-2,3-diacylglucosamine pyrophosphatase LpxH
MSSKKVTSVFLSDLHIGSVNLNHHKLFEFLKSLENEDGSYSVKNIFLVGDIIDMTEFNHKVFWTKHRNIVRKLLRAADKGVNIFYIVGNHDYFLENEILKSEEHLNFNGIQFHREFIYVNNKGQNCLLIHGDQFDGIVALNPILYKIGDVLYHVMHMINKLQNRVRKMFGKSEWSFALWIKTKTKEAVKFMSNFETLVVEKAEKTGADIVVAGHIHQLSDKMIGNVRYMNCGTFCEFQSYIVEYEDGEMCAKYY